MRSEVISRILPHYSWHQIPQLLSVRKEAKSHLSERLWLISTRRKPPLFLLSALHFYKNEYFLIQFYIKLDIFEYHKVKKNRYHIPFVGEKNYKNKDSGSNAQSKCFSSSQFSSVARSCPTLCDHVDGSMPGFPVHNQFPDLAQTHVHLIGDVIQPSHPLPSPSPPAFNLSQHHGLFQWVSSSHQVARELEFQLQHQCFKWIFRTDFF